MIGASERSNEAMYVSLVIHGKYDEKTFVAKSDNVCAPTKKLRMKKVFLSSVIDRASLNGVCMKICRPQRFLGSAIVNRTFFDLASIT